MGIEKIVQLHKNEIYEDIKTFLNNHEQYSKNTRNTFESHIKEFFKITRKVEIEHLREEDLDYKPNDILNYREFLIKRRKNSNNTVNQKVSAIKLLFENLKANGHSINDEIFKAIKPLKVIANQYETLTLEEAEQFVEMAKQEKYLADEKYLLIKFAIRTSFRLDECLNMKWSNIKEEDGVYVVRTIGKGKKKISNSIHSVFFNELSKLKTNNSKKVFSLSEKTVQRMMERLKKKLNIDPKRNITFHSFRNVAGNQEFERNKDIKRAALQLNHSSIETTMKHYLDKTKDYAQSAGVLMDEEIDNKFIDEVSLEEFRKFFKESDYVLQLRLKDFIEGE